MTQTRRAGVVVGIDESLSGLAALRYAVAEARRRGCGLRAVRAWQFGSWRAYDAGPGLAAAALAIAEDAAAAVRRAFESAMGGVPKDIEILAGAIEGAVVPALMAQITSPDDVLRRRRVATAPAGLAVRCGQALCAPRPLSPSWLSPPRTGSHQRTSRAGPGGTARSPAVCGRRRNRVRTGGGDRP